MRTPLLAAFAALAATSCFRGATGPAGLFSLQDPAGDDHGDGELTYPIRDDLRRGDLDLVGFSARAAGEDTEFELTFARAVRRPDARSVDLSGTALSSIAKLGFYTFNVDIYVDVDGVEGSGRRDMLPGRMAEVAASGAWEKVIALTPRPVDAREALRQIWITEKNRARAAQGPVDQSTAGFLEREVERELRSQVYFPNKVHVSGPSVRFTVPRAFLGEPASPAWGYVVAVTAADIATKVKLKALLGMDKESHGLMIVPLTSIATAERLGGGRAIDPLQPPILDIIVPPGMLQEAVLTGPTRKLGERVQVPPVIPAGRPTPAAAPAPVPAPAPDPAPTPAEAMNAGS